MGAQLDVFQQNNPTAYTTISYHMSWPGTDPFYSYNPPDGTARMNLYRPYTTSDPPGGFWVPYMALDGVNDESSATVLQNHILANAQTVAPLAISMAGNFDYQNGNGNVIVTLDPETGITGDYILQVVLVQDGLYYMGSNGNPDHENVMRDMFPSSAGTAITLTEGVQSVEQVDFSVPAQFPVDDCRLVVFVQGTDRIILNAYSAHIAEIAPLNIPQLSALSSNMTIVDDDGDGKLNPGESADYTVLVENNCDWVNAFDVTGYLSSTNPHVTITDSIGSYDMIVSCDAVSNTGDKYGLTVSEDASAVADLGLSLRLTANMDTEAPYEVIITLDENMDLFQANFPVELSQAIVSGNAAVDLNGDGMLEIIVGGSDSLLHVYTLNGEELSGFPFSTQNKITGTPAIGDIDNDGDLEIVIGSRDKHLYVIQHDGSGEAILEAASYLLGTPTLNDLDGDGDLEIIAGGFGYDLLAVHHDGTSLPGYPIMLPDERMSCGVSVADIDGDGSRDIIVGTWGDNLQAFDLSGNSLVGFPVYLGANVVSPPVVTDLDLDGNPEILIGQDDGIFYAISNTGTVLWTQQLSNADIRNSAAIADFNNDGNFEVIFATTDGFITIVDHAGNELAGWPQSVNGACLGSPTLADLDGDEIPEIVIGSGSGELYAYHSDGTLVVDFPLDLGSPISGTPTIADVDQDGDLELIIGADDVLTLIDLKTPVTSGYSWHTARGDYKRTGYFMYPWLSSKPSVLVPRTLQLEQNYPNPFNPTTTISFGIPQREVVSLTIYDILGQEVRALVNSELNSGSYSLIWNGLNSEAKPVGAGIYFARIHAGAAEQVIKMMLIK